MTLWDCMPTSISCSMAWHGTRDSPELQPLGPCNSLSLERRCSSSNVTEGVEECGQAGDVPLRLYEAPLSTSHEPQESQSAASAPEPEWVPLSVRQAQAREKLEEAERQKKMAAILKPLTYDDASGLPCIPNSCLPIKHWNRWLEGSRARAALVKKRDEKARMLANRVMKSLKPKSAELCFESYCDGLARVNDADTPSASAPAHEQGNNTQKPMLSGCSVVPLAIVVLEETNYQKGAVANALEMPGSPAQPEGELHGSPCNVAAMWDAYSFEHLARAKNTLADAFHASSVCC